MLMTTSESDLRIPVKDDDYRDICETVEKICAEFPAKYWRDLEDQPVGHRFPQDFVAALSAAGILGASVPETYGGIELPVAAIVALLITIHASGCNGSVLIPHFTLTHLIARGGTEDLKGMLLPKVAEGSATIISLARQGTESGGGISVRTTGNDVVISGRAARTLAPEHSAFMVVAAEENGGASLFLVDVATARANGVTTEPIRELTSSNVSDVRFDALKLPATCRIGKAGGGAALLAAADVLQRILEAAAAVGDGRFFSRRGVKYANERVVFGHPIGAYQGIQFPLARAHIEVEAAFIGLRRAVALFDAGKDAVGAASVARHLATEAAWNMADAAFTTHGGFSFAREYDIERKWRDVRAAKLAHGSGNDDLKTIGGVQLGFVQLS